MRKTISIWSMVMRKMMYKNKYPGTSWWSQLKLWSWQTNGFRLCPSKKLLQPLPYLMFNKISSLADHPQAIRKHRMLELHQRSEKTSNMMVTIKTCSNTKKKITRITEEEVLTTKWQKVARIMMMMKMMMFSWIDKLAADKIHRRRIRTIGYQRKPPKKRIIKERACLKMGLAQTSWSRVRW